MTGECHSHTTKRPLCQTKNVSMSPPELGPPPSCQVGTLEGGKGMAREHRLGKALQSHQARFKSQTWNVGSSKLIESARVQLKRAAMAIAIRRSMLIPCPR